MKKVLALVLVLALCLTAVASLAEGVAKENIKIGVILLHDEDSTYDLNFINGVKDAAAAYDFKNHSSVRVRLKLKHLIRRLQNAPYK